MTSRVAIVTLCSSVGAAGGLESESIAGLLDVLTVMCGDVLTVDLAADLVAETSVEEREIP
jgi:hypothetical protein